GAILPLGPLVQHTGERPLDELTLQIYPHGTSRFELYEDDGRSNAYRRGGDALTSIECAAEPHRVAVRIDAPRGDPCVAPAGRPRVGRAGGPPLSAPLAAPAPGGGHGRGLGRAAGHRPRRRRAGLVDRRCGLPLYTSSDPSARGRAARRSGDPGRSSAVIR